MRKNNLPRAGRVAVMGIGNELNGDDAAGVLVARSLAVRQARAEKCQGSAFPVQVFAACTAPEAFSGPLRRFQPDLLVLVDAAELGEAPGAVAWLDWTEAASGLSATTHTLSPSLLARFLVKELGCQVLLVGIQPATLEFDAGLSAPVKTAVRRVVNQLSRALFRIPEMG